MIGDFSENYSFLIQNAIQNQHWNNNQCTIHPFVIYSSERDETGQPKIDSTTIVKDTFVYFAKTRLFDSLDINIPRFHYYLFVMICLHYLYNSSMRNYWNRRFVINVFKLVCNYFCNLNETRFNIPPPLLP